MRVVLADDSLLIREGLSGLLKSRGWEVVAAVGDADHLLREVGLSRPDAAVVDIKMPPTHSDEGLRAAAHIRRQYPETGVLVLSEYLDSGYAHRLLSEVPGQIGYLLKDRVTDGDVLIAALQRIVEGECVVDPTIVERLLARRRAAGPLDTVTDREREVLALIAEGRTNTSIGHQLRISQKTLETHIRQIFLKLDLSDAAEGHRRVLAVLAYLRAVDG